MNPTPYTVATPWGGSSTLDEGEGFRAKRLRIKPGKRTSLHRHDRRSEHWIVVEGEATVIIGPNRRIIHLPEGGTFDVMVGQLHRLANDGKEDLVLIEVWRGTELDEADVVRFEDDFGRVDRH